MTLVEATARCVGFLVTLLLAWALAGPLAATTVGIIDLSVGFAKGVEEEREVPARVVVSRPGAEPRTWTATVPGAVQLGGVSIGDRITIEGSGFWVAPEIATAVGTAEEPVSLELAAWPTGELSGRLTVSEGEEPPGRLIVRWDATADLPTGVSAVPHGEETCPVVERQFECQIPAGVLDLRLRATGFVSRYLWDFAIDSGQPNELPLWTLEAGASVVGQVTVIDDDFDPAKTMVRLHPRAGGFARSEGERIRRSRLVLEARIRPNGFFHFDGDISPGSYRLDVIHPGFAAARVFPVQVVPRGETEIREPILLTRPLVLDLVVDPPVTLHGEPWEVELFETGEVPRDFEKVAARPAEVDGTWSQPGLAAGSYRVRVGDDRGNTFAVQALTLEPGDGPTFLILDITPAEGRVWLGEEPLPAALLFGGQQGDERVPVTTDDEGRFEVVLPRPGRWRVAVRSQEPRVARTLSVEIPETPADGQVEIELSDRRVEGVVVDGRGAPVPRAWVEVLELETAERGATTSDDEGRFDLTGLGDGALRAVAFARIDGEPASSAGQWLPPEHDQSVRLVVEPYRSVVGTVTGPSGPVTGAVVVAGVQRRDEIFDPYAETIRAISDVAGRFELRLPTRFSFAEIAVLATGHALTFSRLEGEQTGPLALTVQGLGGTLTLDLGDETFLLDRGETGEVPHLTWEGRLVGVGLLRFWADLQGIAQPSAGYLTVSGMPPGRYELCRVGRQAFFGGERGDGEAQCAARHLAAGDLVELVIARGGDREQ